MGTLIALIIYSLSFGATFLVAHQSFIFFENNNLVQLSYFFVLPIGLITYVTSLGFISLTVQKLIVPGQFPKSLRHPIYFCRRVYGTSWTGIYYFPILFHMILSMHFLKLFVFRLFGYKGSILFTTYPDTWIRDLPLLSFRDGAYIANRATLGSNICLQNGEILVGPIRIGKNSVLGHLGIIGLGSTLGDGSELGVNVATGVKIKVGKNSKIAARSGLNHGCIIGNNVEIGAMSYVGLKSVIKDDVVLPSCSIVPNGITIATQQEADKLISSETSELIKHRMMMNDAVDNFAKNSI